MCYSANTDGLINASLNDFQVFGADARHLVRTIIAWQQILIKFGGEALRGGVFIAHMSIRSGPSYHGSTCNLSLPLLRFYRPAFKEVRYV